MRVVERRRGGWNYDAPPVPRSNRAKIHQRALRMSPGTRKLGAGLLTTLLAMVVFAACFVAFRTIDSKQISVPAVLARLHRSAIALLPPSAPLPASAPASAITPLPPVHNSPDTECDDHRQCTDEEFAGLTDSLGRQWAITPEELRSKCAGYTTYPSLEHCILAGSVSWLDKHPKEQPPGLILRISTRPSWPFAKRIPNPFSLPETVSVCVKRRNETTRWGPRKRIAPDRRQG